MVCCASANLDFKTPFSTSSLLMMSSFSADLVSSAFMVPSFSADLVAIA